MIAVSSAGGCVVPGDDEQVVTVVQGEPQPASDRGKHLPGRLWTSAAFEAAVVVRRHPAQHGGFFSSQARCASALSPGHADVVRLQRLSTGAKKGREVRLVHDNTVPRWSTAIHCLAVPGWRCGLAPPDSG
jgi:hypothetical protein